VGYFRPTGLVAGTLAILMVAACSQMEPLPDSYYSGENVGRYAGLAPPASIHERDTTSVISY